jgi:hypothetical protein
LSKCRPARFRRAGFASASGSSEAEEPFPDRRIAVHRELLEMRDRFVSLYDQVHGLMRRCDSPGRYCTLGEPPQLAMLAPTGCVEDEILQEIT